MGYIAKSITVYEASKTIEYSILRNYHHNTAEVFPSRRDVFVSTPTRAKKSLDLELAQ